jgi:hypothetical protein
MPMVCKLLGCEAIQFDDYWFYPEDGDSSILRKVNKFVPGYRQSHLLRIILMLIAMKIRNVKKKKKSPTFSGSP